MLLLIPKSGLAGCCPLDSDVFSGVEVAAGPLPFPVSGHLNDGLELDAAVPEEPNRPWVGPELELFDSKRPPLPELAGFAPPNELFPEAPLND